ncbi:hypothetical protein [Magnetovibrio blakemorei]|nr:hypothetical protein [Magnetovibrio blakemorei]
MGHVDTPSAQVMRELITREIPNIDADMLEDAMMHIGFARDQYDRYAKSRKTTNGRFTYKSKKSSCHRIKNLIKQLKEEVQTADLMLLDELHSYLGSDDFQGELTAELDRLSTACDVLLKTVPTFAETGRPVDRILYDWVLNMVRIYVDLFKPKKIDHRKNGTFMEFLKCWKPDELPIYGDKLSSRTIQRILEFRMYYKEDLRNTFKPAHTYSPKQWADKKPASSEK